MPKTAFCLPPWSSRGACACNSKPHTDTLLWEQKEAAGDTYFPSIGNKPSFYLHYILRCTFCTWTMSVIWLICDITKRITTLCCIALIFLTGINHIPLQPPGRIFTWECTVTATFWMLKSRELPVEVCACVNKHDVFHFSRANPLHEAEINWNEWFVDI